MNEKRRKGSKHKSAATALPGVSFVLPNGVLAELVYDPKAHKTAFAVYEKDTFRVENELIVKDKRYRPYSPNNNLIANEVVLLPSGVEEYGREEELIESIRGYLHRYVDLSPKYERLCSYYVLFSWLHDAFNELPYLRARGDYGCGKTRFLVTAGAICYRPIFASGASTVSPLFRILDVFRGTLVVDESDLRWSDEHAEFVKILNNGNVRGFPVLRCDVSNQGEYNPHAYAVYGPKLLASRGAFQDRALESRFLTEDMGLRRLRDDVPINLPPEQKQEALRLRNQLLLFRFRNWGHTKLAPELSDPDLEPRLNQIFTPLLSIIQDPSAREEIRELARSYDRSLSAERGLTLESQVLDAIRQVEMESSGAPSIQAITQAYIERHAGESDRKITAKWIGSVIRHRLHLQTQKSHGVYVIPPPESPKLSRLYEKYETNSAKHGDGDGEENNQHQGDLGDVGDF